ncbi:MAG: DUF3224 domain-containing protein [Frankia sp.]
MTTTLETKFTITSWDEQTYRELPDGSKFTRADVVLTGTGDGLDTATFEALMYYRPDGTSSYTTLMRIVGELAGRQGSFVLRGDGTFDGTAARGASTVVTGSGTDGLAGITGVSESVSTHADYPFMPFTLRFDLG